MNPKHTRAKINRARAKWVVYSAGHMARQIGAPLAHLRRRRPIRPFTFHADSLRTGPGKPFPANPHAILNRFLAGKNIIKAAFVRRNDDRTRRIAAMLSLIHISEPTRRTPISYAV